MTVQVTTTPPGSSEVLETGAEILVPAAGGVFYGLRDVLPNGELGEPIAFSELVTEVVGDDLVVTCADGTVLVFVGWVSAALNPALALGPTPTSSLEAELEPAAGGPGGPDGAADDGGSSALVEAFLASLFRMFGNAPEADILLPPRPGIELPDFLDPLFLDGVPTLEALTLLNLGPARLMVLEDKALALVLPEGFGGGPTTISGLPEGATVVTPGGEIPVGPGGVVTLGSPEGLSIVPPLHDDKNFTVTVLQGDGTTLITGTIDIMVKAVADPAKIFLDRPGKPNVDIGDPDYLGGKNPVQWEMEPYLCAGHNDTPQDAMDLGRLDGTNGVALTVNGWLATAEFKDVDVYKFTITQKGRYDIDIDFGDLFGRGRPVESNAHMGRVDDADAALFLFRLDDDGNAVLVAYDKNGGPRKDPLIDKQLLKEGMYFVAVTQQDNVDFREIRARWGDDEPISFDEIFGHLEAGREGNELYGNRDDDGDYQLQIRPYDPQRPEDDITPGNMVNVMVVEDNPMKTFDGDFEFGEFSGWMAIGDTAFVGDDRPDAGPDAQVPSGDTQVLLTTRSAEDEAPGEGGARRVDDIAEFFDIDPELLRRLGDIGEDEPMDNVEGTAIKGKFWAKAGQTLTFDWNFLTDEDRNDTDFDEQNDSAFIVIKDDLGNILHGPIALIDFAGMEPLEKEDGSFGFDEETGYGVVEPNTMTTDNGGAKQPFTWTFPSTGVFHVGIGVLDKGDELFDSGLLIDNVAVDGVTPGNIMMLGVSGRGSGGENVRPEQAPGQLFMVDQGDGEAERISTSDSVKEGLTGLAVNQDSGVTHATSIGRGNPLRIEPPEEEGGERPEPAARVSHLVQLDPKTGDVIGGPIGITAATGNEMKVITFRGEARDIEEGSFYDEQGYALEALDTPRDDAEERPDDLDIRVFGASDGYLRMQPGGENPSTKFSLKAVNGQLFSLAAFDIESENLEFLESLTVTALDAWGEALGSFTLRFGHGDVDHLGTIALPTGFPKNVAEVRFEIEGPLAGDDEWLDIDNIKIVESGIAISDLSYQPDTGELYGAGSSADGRSGGKLFIIDTTTGIATPIGDLSETLDTPEKDFTIDAFSIAFDHDTGALYAVVRNVTEEGTENFFVRLDPDDATPLGEPLPITTPNLSIETIFFDGLGVRPNDGTIFATAGGQQLGETIFTIDPETGEAEFVGPNDARLEGENLTLADLDFFVKPQKYLDTENKHTLERLDLMVRDPDGTESITFVKIDINDLNGGNDLPPGFMIGFGEIHDGGDDEDDNGERGLSGGEDNGNFLEHGLNRVWLNVTRIDSNDPDVGPEGAVTAPIKVRVFYDEDEGLIYFRLPDHLRVQNVDLGGLMWKAEKSNDQDFNMEIMVRTTETHHEFSVHPNKHVVDDSPGLTIVDGQTVMATIDVSGIDDGEVIHDLNLLTRIAGHGDTDDLIITLTSPAGTTVTISSENDFRAGRTRWDDQENDPVTVDQGGDRKLTVESALAAFVGEDPNGPWKISITDTSMEVITFEDFSQTTGSYSEAGMELNALGDGGRMDIRHHGGALDEGPGESELLMDFGSQRIFELKPQDSSKTFRLFQFEIEGEVLFEDQSLIVRAFDPSDPTNEIASFAVDGFTDVEGATAGEENLGVIKVPEGFPTEVSRVTFELDGPALGETLVIDDIKTSLAMPDGFFDEWALKLKTIPEDQLSLVMYGPFESGPLEKPIAHDGGDRRFGEPTEDRIWVEGVKGKIKDVDLNTEISHEDSGSLIIKLVSPDGTSVLIVRGEADPSQFANLFADTNWDDQANNPVSDAVFVDGELQPELTPESAMAAFKGEDPNGYWTIRIFDLEGGGLENGITTTEEYVDPTTGSLEGWGLKFTVFDGQELGVPHFYNSTTIMVNTKAVADKPMFGKLVTVEFGDGRPEFFHDDDRGEEEPGQEEEPGPELETLNGPGGDVYEEGGLFFQVVQGSVVLKDRVDDEQENARELGLSKGDVLRITADEGARFSFISFSVDKESFEARQRETIKFYGELDGETVAVFELSGNLWAPETILLPSTFMDVDTVYVETRFRNELDDERPDFAFLDDMKFKLPLMAVDVYEDNAMHINGSFESGGINGELLSPIVLGGSDVSDPFAGWMTVGDIRVEPGRMVLPTDGLSQAVLTTSADDGAVRDSELEWQMGLPKNALDRLIRQHQREQDAEPKEVFSANAREGSAMKVTLKLDAGDKVSFDWNMLTREPLPERDGGPGPNPNPNGPGGPNGEPDWDADDFGFVFVLGPPSTGGPTVLTSTMLTPTDFDGGAVGGFPASTGYETFLFQVPEAGSYTFVIGVADEHDRGGKSALLVDNLSVNGWPVDPEVLTDTSSYYGAQMGVSVTDTDGSESLTSFGIKYDPNSFPFTGDPELGIADAVISVDGQTKVEVGDVITLKDVMRLDQYGEPVSGAVWAEVTRIYEDPKNGFITVEFSLDPADRIQQINVTDEVGVLMPMHKDGSFDVWVLATATETNPSDMVTLIDGKTKLPLDFAVFTQENGQPIRNDGPVNGVPGSDDTPTMSTITVAGVEGPIENIDMMTLIRHRSSGDMKITLISPDGTTVTVSNENGGDFNNLFKGTFWSDGAPNVSGFVFTVNGKATPLGPEGPFAAFKGENPNGQWKLQIEDLSKGEMDGKAKVAVFANGAFVDLEGTIEGSAEAIEIQETLKQLDHKVTPFESLDAAGIAAALVGKDVLVIPEQEVGPLAGALSEAALEVIREFVTTGGKLIISGSIGEGDEENAADFLNALFGHSLDELGSTGNSTLTGGEDGTVFDDGLEPLLGNDATSTLTDLPSNATAIYEDGEGNATVVLFDEGDGQVVFLGWDWFKAEPAPGDQNGGWLDVLDSAARMGDDTRGRLKGWELLIKTDMTKDQIAVESQTMVDTLTFKIGAVADKVDFSMVETMVMGTEDLLTNDTSQAMKGVGERYDVGELESVAQFGDRAEFGRDPRSRPPLEIGDGDEGRDFHTKQFSGSLYSPEDSDVYSFFAYEGEEILVDLDEGLEHGEDSVRTKIELVGPDGTLIAFDTGDNSNGDGDPEIPDDFFQNGIPHRAGETGTYYVIVRSAGNGSLATGDYELFIGIDKESVEVDTFGRGSAKAMIDLDELFSPGNPGEGIPLDFKVETPDQDGSERLSALRLTGLQPGASVSYLAADGVTRLTETDGDGDGRIEIDLAAYSERDSIFRDSLTGKLLFLDTGIGDPGLDLRLHPAEDDGDNMWVGLEVQTTESMPMDPSNVKVPFTWTTFMGEMQNLDFDRPGPMRQDSYEEDGFVLSSGEGGDIVVNSGGEPKKIALFDNGEFVDTEPGDPGGSSRESDEIRQSLEAFGHDVMTFNGGPNGFGAAAWEAALDGKDVLVIPELELGDLALALEEGPGGRDTLAVIRDFIGGGGKLVISADNAAEDVTGANGPGDAVALLNTLFNFAMEMTDSEVSGTSSKTAEADDTFFVNAPDSLPDFARVSGIDQLTLPALAKTIYEVGNESTVVLFEGGPLGDGQAVYLGWDWFRAAPPADARDGGWLKVLNTAVKMSADKDLVLHAADDDVRNRAEVAKLTHGTGKPFDLISFDIEYEDLEGGELFIATGFDAHGNEIDSLVIRLADLENGPQDHTVALPATFRQVSKVIFEIEGSEDGDLLEGFFGDRIQLDNFMVKGPGTIDVTIKEIADDPRLAVSDQVECEDNAKPMEDESGEAVEPVMYVDGMPLYPVPIQAGVADRDGSEAITRVVLASDFEDQGLSLGDIKYLIGDQEIGPLDEIQGESRAVEIKVLGEGFPDDGQTRFDAKAYADGDNLVIEIVPGERVQALDLANLRVMLPQHKDGKFSFDVDVRSTEIEVYRLDFDKPGGGLNETDYSEQGFQFRGLFARTDFVPNGDADKELVFPNESSDGGFARLRALNGEPFDLLQVEVQAAGLEGSQGEFLRITGFAVDAYGNREEVASFETSGSGTLSLPSSFRGVSYVEFELVDDDPAFGGSGGPDDRPDRMHIDNVIVAQTPGDGPNAVSHAVTKDSFMLTVEAVADKAMVGESVTVRFGDVGLGNPTFYQESGMAFRRIIDKGFAIVEDDQPSNGEAELRLEGRTLPDGFSISHMDGSTRFSFHSFRLETSTLESDNWVDFMAMRDGQEVGRYRVFNDPGPGVYELPPSFMDIDEVRVFIYADSAVNEDRFVIDDLKFKLPLDMVMFHEDNAMPVGDGEQEVAVMWADKEPVYDLPFQTQVVDTDGSESITEITLTLEAAEAWTHLGQDIQDGESYRFDNASGLGSGSLRALATLDGNELTLTFSEDLRLQKVSLDELGVRLPQHLHGTFTVDYTVVTAETDPMNGVKQGAREATLSDSFTFVVGAVADKPLIEDPGADDNDGPPMVMGHQGEPISLHFEISDPDRDGSEGLKNIRISGLPVFDNEGGPDAGSISYVNNLGTTVTLDVEPDGTVGFSLAQYADIEPPLTEAELGVTTVADLGGAGDRSVVVVDTGPDGIELLYHPPAGFLSNKDAAGEFEPTKIEITVNTEEEFAPVKVMENVQTIEVDLVVKETELEFVEPVGEKQGENEAITLKGVNDTGATAQDLGTLNVGSTGAHLSVGGWIAKGMSDDVDFYRFTLDAPVATTPFVYIDIDMGDGGDDAVDLELSLWWEAFNPPRQLIAPNLTSTNPHERGAENDVATGAVDDPTNGTALDPFINGTGLFVPSTYVLAVSSSGARPNFDGTLGGTPSGDGGDYMLQIRLQPEDVSTDGPSIELAAAPPAPFAATDDEAVTNEAGALEIPVAALLANDALDGAAPDDGSFGFELVAGSYTGTQGSVSIDDNGTTDTTLDDTILISNVDEGGTRQFEYRITNSALTATALVMITHASGSVVAGDLTADSILVADEGSSGTQTMTGGTGDDFFIVEHDSPVEVTDAGGTDTVLPSFDADFLGSLEDPFAIELKSGFDPGNGIETIDGSLFPNDVVIRDPSGSSGSHWTADFSDTDLVEIAEIQGRDGNDSIVGSGGDDVIYGGAGNDTIDGGAGNDTIFGGPGDDVVTGGEGDDVFHVLGLDFFDSGTGIQRIFDSGSLRITDFEPGKDKLQIDSDYTPSLAQLDGWVGSGSGQITFADNGADTTLVFNESDGSDDFHLVLESITGDGNAAVGGQIDTFTELNTILNSAGTPIDFV